jgi:hypothetical protein
MDSPLVKVKHIASRQHALVTWDQLQDSGVTDAQIKHLVRRRLLRRVRPRVYAIAGSPPTWEQGLLGIVLSIGDGAVASHASGAQLWDYVRLPEDRCEVTVLRDRFPTMAGVTIHRSKHLDPADVTERRGIPCTTFERTLCDCTTVLSKQQLGTVLDEGLRRGVASLRQLKDCAERLESGPGRHMSVVRALLAERGIDFNPGGSGSELRVLKVLRKAGMPLPVQQHPVRFGRRTYYLDYSYPAYEIFMEYYGLVVHSGASAVAYDNDRITDLSSIGWLPLIFTDETPDRVIVERVASALRARVGRLTGTE